MRMQSLLFGTIFLVSAGVPAAAQQAEINYPKGSLAIEAIADADYAGAEALLRNEVRVAKGDPARLINHGYVLAKIGRVAEAAKLFQKAAHAEEIELILADGRVLSSRQAATEALQSVAMGGPERDTD